MRHVEVGPLLIKEEMDDDVSVEEIKVHCSKDGYEQMLREESTSASTEFKWTNSTIKLLLQIRLNMEDEFNKPACRKRKLWESIAQQMNEITDFNLTSDVCDSKYRNLLGTYRVNKRKERKLGKETIKWEFFEQIDEVLQQKAPPKNILGSTVDDTGILFEVTVESDVESDVDNLATKKEHKERVKKVTEISLERYLYLKLERDKKKELMKLFREEERWNEKKELKLKEIDAINNLADAIRGTYERN